MLSKRAQETIELSKPTDKKPRDGTAGESPLGRHVFRLPNVVSFLLALIVLYLGYRELLGLDWREAWANVQGANVGLFVLAFALFYCTFPLRALRWKVLLGNVGYNDTAVRLMPSSLGLTRIIYLGCFANSLALARLGDAYRGYLLKNVAGVSFVVTLGTVLAERLLDTFVVALMMGAGLLVVFHGSLPMEATQLLSAGLILSAIGVLGLLSMRRLRGVFERILPKGLHAHYSHFEHGLVSSFRCLPLLVTYSVAGWLIEGAALYMIAVAVGTPVSVAGALLVALAAALLTSVPITPSGLGFTEGGMIIILGWLGLDTYTASAITLLFRIINYWSIIVFGLVIYLFSRRRSKTTSFHQRKVGPTL
ncbi:MAG: glycosyltransferase 2 family protein [Rubrobacteraceae bacterium]|nr:glycosyltransferase 2 family protein [Rubrobacteraceae bacterium]